MGRYYNAITVAQEGRHLGSGLGCYEKPRSLGEGNTLVGIVLEASDREVTAIAPDLTDDRQYRHYCIERKETTPGLLMVELYTLTPEQVARIHDAPMILVADLEEFLRKGTTSTRYK